MRVHPSEPSGLDDLELEILSRLAAGEEPVTRLCTMRWFTYEVDGEPVVVGPEMQRRLEEAAGTQLVEYTREQYPGELALGFRPSDLGAVQRRLAERTTAAGQDRA